MASTYTTVAQVEAELRATTSFDTDTYPSLATVTSWIGDISAYIDTIAFDVASQTTSTDYITYTGQEIITLDKFPIISITSLSENTNPLGSDLGEAWVTKTQGTHYFVNENSGEILLNLPRWTPGKGFRKLKLVSVTGFATTPPTHNMLATKMVAYRVLSSLINNKVQEGSTGGSVSVGSINIVEPADYGLRSYNQLNTEIDALKNELLGGAGVYRYTC